MRKFLLVAFAVLIVGVVALVGFVKFVLAPEGVRADASSRAYAQRIVGSVLQNWDARAMRAEGSSEFFEHVSTRQLDGLFDTFSRRLGPIQTAGEPKGQAGINITYPAGKVVSAIYLVPVQFERGTGQIRLTLLQKDGRWQLAGVYVTSDALFDMPGGTVPSELPPDVRTATRAD